MLHNDSIIDTSDIQNYYFSSIKPNIDLPIVTKTDITLNDIESYRRRYRQTDDEYEFDLEAEFLEDYDVSPHCGYWLEGRGELIIDEEFKDWAFEFGNVDDINQHQFIFSEGLGNYI